MSADGRNKKARVSDAAWSLVLGQDKLPQALLSSSSYQRNQILVFARTQQSFLACSQFPALQRQATSICSNSSAAIGISFIDVSFEAIRSRKGEQTVMQASFPTTTCTVLEPDLDQLLHLGAGSTSAGKRMYIEVNSDEDIAISDAEDEVVKVCTCHLWCSFCGCSCPRADVWELLV